VESGGESCSFFGYGTESDPSHLLAAANRSKMLCVGFDKLSYPVRSRRPSPLSPDLRLQYLRVSKRGETSIRKNQLSLVVKEFACR